ncbi:MAG: response regulator, partial [Actinobacteria bacterium]|nr:response regulator [Actinomycetota bacterium]
MIKTARILLIDDDISLCTVVSHQLEGMGYNVQIANRGAEGIEKLHKKSFDLVLLDLQMPEMPGMEALKRIRLFNDQIPVIIITAFGTIENAVQACRKGADDYLPKPFAKEQLLFTIEKALRLKNLENDNRRLQSELEEKYRFGNIISKNKKMQA